MIQDDDYDDLSFNNPNLQMLQEAKQLGVNIVHHELQTI
jgi:hypothetical protein